MILTWQMNGLVFMKILLLPLNFFFITFQDKNLDQKIENKLIPTIAFLDIFNIYF